MLITLNNNKEEILGFEQITVSQLLALKNYTFKLLIVRINNKTVPRDEYDKTYIKDGDNVMVLHLITGG